MLTASDMCITLLSIFNSSEEIFVILLSFLCELFPIGLNLMRVEVTKLSLLTLEITIGSVVAVLHFHSCIFAEIDIVAPRLLPSKVVLNAHVHVECLICFLLAILNAFELTLLFRSHEVQINAVFVALFEKNLWESMLFKRFYTVVRVACPVAVGSHYF